MNYKIITEIGGSKFNLYDVGLDDENYNTLIQFFYDLLINKLNIEIKYIDNNNDNNYNIITKTISDNWFIEVKVSKYLLSNILRINNHKFISIILISDIGEEFLLFTIGADGTYYNNNNIKYTIKIPDIITIYCFMKENMIPDKCKNITSFTAKKIKIRDNNLNSKIYFFLVLIRTLKTYFNYTKKLQIENYKLKITN
jgi:hypothetical protein